MHQSMWSVLLKHVVSSAVEAETGGLFHNTKMAIFIIKMLESLGHKQLTGVIGVRFDRKGSQGQQAHGITVFQRLHIAMTQ